MTIGQTIDRLTRLDYAVSNSYGDGVVRMVKVLDNEIIIDVFVRADGSISRPHTYETKIASAELLDAGFKFDKTDGSAGQ